MLGVFELVPGINAFERFVALEEKTMKLPFGGAAGSRLAKSGAVELIPTDTCSAPVHDSCAWATLLTV
jgi:hypothetical protein